MLVDPKQNPVRDQTIPAQIKFHSINLGVRQVSRRLKKDTKGGRKYRMTYTDKELSAVNMKKRVEYGREHADKHVDDFWAYILFTDETHFDPASQRQGWVLREEGTRYDPENIQKRPPKKGVEVHAAAWVTWHAKADKLEFFNDEHHDIIKPKKPRRPRHRKNESAQQWEERLKAYEAEMARLKPELELKPKGNSMTQEYYTQRLLPVYIDAVHHLRAESPQTWILQEDNDRSHGHGVLGPATLLKDANWIDTLIHPPQSPDLNPIESCWMIMKQRVQQRIWHSRTEYMEVLQDEWGKITMAEVRARIATMPHRCKQLVETGGEPIKSDLW